MPTGVAIRDVREQLFEAAERVLLKDGPSALTSRAVTTEAGCAKGVLHRHFTDFDDFLAQLVTDRVTRLETITLTPGTATITATLAGALAEIFTPVAVSMVALITFRDDLRARLRTRWPVGVPLLTEAVRLVETYLRAERSAARLKPTADPATLAPTLIGAAHLLYSDRQSPPTPESLRTTISTTLSPFTPPPA